MKVSKNGASVCELITAPANEGFQTQTAAPPHRAGVRTRLPVGTQVAPRRPGAVEPRVGCSGHRSPDWNSRCDLGECFSRRL